MCQCFWSCLAGAWQTSHSYNGVGLPTALNGKSSRVHRLSIVGGQPAVAETNRRRINLTQSGRLLPRILTHTVKNEFRSRPTEAKTSADTSCLHSLSNCSRCEGRRKPLALR